MGVLGLSVGIELTGLLYMFLYVRGKLLAMGDTLSRAAASTAEASQVDIYISDVTSSIGEGALFSLEVR